MALESKFAESTVDARHDAAEDVHGILFDPTSRRKKGTVKKRYEINCCSWLCVASRLGAFFFTGCHCLPRMKVDLAVFELVANHQVALLIENEEAGGGGAVVDGSDV